MDDEAEAGSEESGAESPELVRVEDGAVPVPDGLLESPGFEEGDQIVLVPVPDGLLLRRLELPTVGEYGEWVERNAAELGISTDEMADLLHRYIAGEEGAEGVPEGGAATEDG